MKNVKEKISAFVASFDDAGREKWNEEKQWWEPVIYFEDSEFYEGNNVSWLCDHLGDAQAIMEAMWCEIMRLRSEANTNNRREKEAKK